MCVTIIKHIQRVFAFDLAKLEPLPAEATKLEDTSITNEFLGSYLVWRHSMLHVSLPALFIICISDWIGLAATVENMEVLTAVGKVLLSLPSFASTVLSIAVVWALCGWTQWRRSAHILKIGWLISFVLVFVPALFPLEYILDREAYIQDPDEAVKLLLDLEYDGIKIHDYPVSGACDLACRSRTCDSQDPWTLPRSNALGLGSYVFCAFFFRH
jgi:hypothetical protein